MDYTLSGEEAGAVVLAAIGMYAAILLTMRVTGRRLVAGLTPYDVVAAVGIGALMGRSILGYTPTLTAGVLGLSTLALLHLGSRALAGAPIGQQLFGPGPLLLLRDGQVVPGALAAARLSEADLHVALRRTGVAGYADVAAAVLERAGSISVIRSTASGAEALADVPGWTIRS